MENPAQLNYKALAHSIQSGKCILVLGRGASTYLEAGQETPIHLKLSRQLWERLGERKSEVDPDDLRHVSQVVYDKSRSLTELQIDVADFYEQFSGSTTEFHRNLAALPFQVCITTGPDDFLFKAFEDAGKRPVREYYDFRAKRDVAITEPSVQCPLIYHFYGHTESLESLVITENDLIDFLTKIVKNDPPLPSFIRATLSRKETACLFLDLEFKNWYLRVLMHVLGFQEHHADKSWAVERQDFFTGSKQHQSIAYFTSLETINFHQESLTDFVRRLRTAYEATRKSPAQPMSEPAADAPVAFLSYASEDKSLVDDLHSRLENSGIRVWQDKDKLRGGDNWENQLTHVIRKRADYVIVVQTPNMASRVKGVFNAEIDEALKTQREMPRFRFVIPVHTNDHCLLPELEKLHTVPVRTGEEVSALAASILDDWRARANLRMTAGAGGGG